MSNTWFSLPPWELATFHTAVACVEGGAIHIEEEPPVHEVTCPDLLRLIR